MFFGTVNELNIKIQGLEVNGMDAKKRSFFFGNERLALSKRQIMKNNFGNLSSLDYILENECRDGLPVEISDDIMWHLYIVLNG